MRLGESRVQRVRIVRVEDERIDVLRDQGPEVGQLAGSVSVAVDDVERRDDLGRSKRGHLGLRGADLLLAEAVTDAATVRVTDGERAGRVGCWRGRRAGAAGDEDEHHASQHPEDRKPGRFDHYLSSSSMWAIDVDPWEPFAVSHLLLVWRSRGPDAARALYMPARRVRWTAPGRRRPPE